MHLRSSSHGWPSATLPWSKARGDAPCQTLAIVSSEGGEGGLLFQRSLPPALRPEQAITRGAGKDDPRQRFQGACACGKRSFAVHLLAVLFLKVVAAAKVEAVDRHVGAEVRGKGDAKETCKVGEMKTGHRTNTGTLSKRCAGRGRGADKTGNEGS